MHRVEPTDIFSRVVPRSHLLTESEATLRFGSSTIGAKRRISGAVRPSNQDQVQTILQIAQKYGQSIYPISTGNNWGYGSGLPVESGAIILDLSGLRSIVGFCRESGVVTLEPGVTQQQLFEFLNTRHLDFMVPTHGGGPSCSIVGNALERGYGITPTTDHFSAVRQIKAFLPDGSPYGGILEASGCEDLARDFKWGVGPYLDGMFTQSNFGVVTQMSIKLARRPESIDCVLFDVNHDNLEESIPAINTILETLPGIAGAFNLMNARRVLSMLIQHPDPTGQRILSQEFVGREARRLGVSDWVGLGAIYGTKRVTRAARKEIKGILRRSSQKCVVIDERKGAILNTIARALPKQSTIKTRIDKLDEARRILAGQPSEAALPLAYWRSESQPNSKQGLHPARDRCGLMWYAPLVPMKSSSVQSYVKMVERVCAEHFIEPLITLTAIEAGICDSTIPILFDQSSHEATRRARDCYDALLEQGRSLGVLPYRFSVAHMQRLSEMNTSYYDLVSKIKKTIDPAGVLAPGRYAPKSDNARERSGCTFESDDGTGSSLGIQSHDLLRSQSNPS